MNTPARGIVTRQGQDPQGLGAEGIEPGREATRPEEPSPLPQPAEPAPVREALRELEAALKERDWLRDGGHADSAHSLAVDKADNALRMEKARAAARAALLLHPQPLVVEALALPGFVSINGHVHAVKPMCPGVNGPTEA